MLFCCKPRAKFYTAFICRPQSKRDNRSAKCRAQFGIRSGPKQISAYFNDMGSITFDILSSPTSLPIGRVLVGILTKNIVLTSQ